MQVCRCAGVQVCRCAGVQVCRSTTCKCTTDAMVSAAYNMHVTYCQTGTTAAVLELDHTCTNPRKLTTMPMILCCQSRPSTPGSRYTPTARPATLMRKPSSARILCRWNHQESEPRTVRKHAITTPKGIRQPQEMHISHPWTCSTTYSGVTDC